MSLLTFTDKGIFCPAANVYIDPWRPVNQAIITHGHSDHARWGSNRYLAHKDSSVILRQRLGADINLQTVEYGEKVMVNNVEFSLHPAGHILGSAQIRVEHKGEVWVVSGDYKRESDNFCIPFEPVRCNAFVTESTFGLPVYKWRPQAEIFSEVKSWWRENRMKGHATVLMGYALGKMQRLITGLLPFDGPVYAHGAIFNLNESLRLAGYNLPFIPRVTADLPKDVFRDALILAPRSAMNSSWMKRFSPYSTGYCSGWMNLRGAKNRASVDRGFVLSDHADWEELNRTVKETEAEKVYVTHGYTSQFSKWLMENNIESYEVETLYGNEEEEEVPEENP